ncbi:putative GPI anchored protein [Aspergillus clavatus NRRL 1]|uniref:GPI anchored protein, putative n=1 Tax=Aspergillus clavatus (strain ATCC 1007 / CBS 513.65 / DSM 816 / NCTC 3887 / NRRL 1 / QM 1276 / 107) TaxID=344612 RepID=A1CMN5_ASPCL|nr:GPI anchored protein, putative [Aspergillus clavatus NRRL 1]EAW08822.1 GPI anchored protein, putative [Aspergillus clavatus NRRL 1]
MKFSPVYLLSLAPLAAAHFKLEYPASRGRNEDTMANYPCGGMAQSSNRTQIPLSGSFPVAVTLGHAQTALEVLLALGSNPGDNFNITLHQTFRVEGLGAFCLPDIVFDESVLGVNITDGMNATLQVQSNGDPTGGLYACADIQFSSSAKVDEASCKNNTGINAVAFAGDAAKRNANESTSDGQAQGSSGSNSDSHSHSGSNSATQTQGTAASSTGGAVALQTAAWGVFGAAVVGGLAVL